MSVAEKRLPNAPKDANAGLGISSGADPLTQLKDILGVLPDQQEFTIKEVQSDLPTTIDNKVKSLEESRFKSSTSDYGVNTEELDSLLEFHSTVSEFNELLTPLKTYLEQFNKNLINLSKGLESLKSRSVNLSSSLGKRTNLEKKYIPIVSDLIIPPEIVKDIYNGELTPQWCEENLQFLTDKVEIYSKYDKDPELKDMKSLINLKKLLDSLHLKALERIKNFIVSKIKKLRVIGTASQVVQSELIKVKEIFPFLSKRQPSLALELRQAYVYTMKWYYQSHFHRYEHSLEKLKLQLYDKNYLIGGSTSFFKTKNPHSDYSIGRRAQIIKAEDPTVMLAQIAETNPIQFNIETGFRSFNLAVLDNGSVEYLFLSEFFQMGPETNGVFEQIFSPTYDLGINYTKKLIVETYDILGVLLLIRLSQSLNFELQKRRIPVIEGYLNLQMIVLWPKFQKLIDLNCENMKRTSLSSSSITGMKANSPHNLTIQFTNLIHGFLKLTLEEHQETTQEPLSNSISRLRTEFESILTKLSKNVKQSEVFLYNNYFYVYGILSECEGNLAVAETEHFRLLTEAFTPK